MGSSVWKVNDLGGLLNCPCEPLQRKSGLVSPGLGGPSCLLGPSQGWLQLGGVRPGGTEPHCL